MKFYRCSVCGNLVAVVEDGGNTPTCCGRTMHSLYSGETDGNVATHRPEIFLSNCISSTDKICKWRVCVGYKTHPMEAGHKIQWIVVETDRGFYYADLKDKNEACAYFYISQKETIKSVYAYCNLHGLWENKIPMEDD